MADFLPIYNVTLKKEGGYQANANDSGNYCFSFINRVRTRGALIGTNMGISATALQVYLKRCPTIAEMKAMTPNLAYKIYKAQFWDVISGDKIKNQSIAKLMFTMFIQNGNVIKIRKAVNAACLIQFKKKLMYDRTMSGAAPKNWQYSIGINGILIVNALTPSTLFTELKKEQLAHYDSIKHTSVGIANYKGWISRLSAINFIPTDKTTGVSGFFLEQFS